MSFKLNAPWASNEKSDSLTEIKNQYILPKIMQLKSIKLIGFKSFADHTIFPMPSRFNAIVGPNGCGKSNVIDALRWVIGETSAKQLRGQSMADVIFNGSSNRKPVGKAAVELLFDNSEGRIGGEYAKYAEIAVRREITRDGLSDYFLNGVSCRRKDIVDIFLGTGLGPRSYAIIEQGMVSRLVDAKPDELRVYLEEAAGISKYKDRRRETETRMRHTQENLDRVNDLCLEIGKQLAHLEKQAKTAEKYQELRKEERRLEIELATLEWKKCEEELLEKDRVLNQITLQQESLLADQRHLETQTEVQRAEEKGAQETQSETQKQFYGLGAEIARIEQQLKHMQEQAHQWELELDETTTLSQEMQASLKNHETQLLDLQGKVEQFKPDQEKALHEKNTASLHLQEAEKNMQAWQEKWDAFQASNAQASQQVEVSKTKIHHLKQQQEQLRSRQDVIQHQRAQLPIDPLLSSMQSLSLAVDALSAERADAQHQVTHLREAIARQREINQKTQTDLNIVQETIARLEQRQASVEALQKAALGKNNKATESWLAEQHLNEKPRFAEALRVDTGWEQAVETVLHGFFDAICAEPSDITFDKLSTLAHGQLTFLEKATTEHSATATTLPLTRLSSKAHSAWPALHLLSNIFVVEDITEAQRYRPQLQAHETLITRDGIWLSPYWIRIRKGDNADDGVLVRKQILEELHTQITEKKQALEQAQHVLSEGEAGLKQKEAELENQLHVHNTLQNRWAEKQAELRTVEARLRELQQQQAIFVQELSLLAQQMETVDQELVRAENARQAAAGLHTEQESLRQALFSERDVHRDAVNHAREELSVAERTAEQLHLQFSMHTQQIALLQQTQERESRQLAQFSGKKAALQNQLLENEMPKEEMTQKLQVLLKERVQIETRLKSAERLLQDIVDRIAALNELWQENHRKQQNVQQEIQQLQIARQTILVNQEHFKAQVEAKQEAIERVMQSLPSEAELLAWKELLEKTIQRIERLGPINLAAIEECQSLSERKTYLDKQQADLQEALQILADAIRKIDHETKAKFKETYENVNASFSELFPRIFGGGSASLELLEDDLLNTGVAVKAQPPGKRNATIHMLSGGEKALTAIALVFAFFQLNPAPFCILDEVDAPLDDANVGRYCQLIRDMSQTIQFIVISHNKVTIESADALLGVTMQEAGVSRVVSVDMEAAVAMVQ